MENNILNSKRRKTCIIERARKTDFLSGFVSLQTVPSLFCLIIPPFFFFLFLSLPKIVSSVGPSVRPSMAPSLGSKLKLHYFHFFNFWGGRWVWRSLHKRNLANFGNMSERREIIKQLTTPPGFLCFNFVASKV